MASTGIKFGGSSVKCHACQKTVYPLEAVTLSDTSFHKRCFKCAKCDCVVSPASCAMFKQTPYCKVHFLEMFKERGTYAVFSDDYDPTAPAFRSRSGGIQSHASSSSPPSQPLPISPIIRCSSSSSTEEAGVKLHPPVGSVAARLKKFNTADVTSLSPPPSPIRLVATTIESATPLPEDEEPGAADVASSDGLNESIFDAIMKNNPEQLRKAIDQAGLSALFDKNDNGETPIELAFTNTSIECGRAMISIVEKQLVQLRSH